jgi:hypothetical protein
MELARAAHAVLAMQSFQRVAHAPSGFVVHPAQSLHAPVSHAPGLVGGPAQKDPPDQPGAVAPLQLV